MSTASSKSRAPRAQPSAARKAGPDVEIDKLAGMSSAAVRAKTGKTWTEWKKALDAAGAKKMSHREIATHLREAHGVGDWWCQMVAVGYERLDGRRARHQKSDGQFSASASRTLGVSIGRLYRAWADDAQRAHWLAEKGLTIRTARVNKSLRITWSDGDSSVVIMFYSKGNAKSQVTVEHNKLASAKDVARCKAYWKKRLDDLTEFLG